jgi:hypothetical protein
MSKKGGGRQAFAEGLAKRLKLNQAQRTYLAQLDKLYAQRESARGGFQLRNPAQAKCIDEEIAAIIDEHPIPTSLSQQEQVRIEQDYSACYGIAGQLKTLEGALEVFAIGHEDFIDRYAANPDKIKKRDARSRQACREL